MKFIPNVYVRKNGVWKQQIFKKPATNSRRYFVMFSVGNHGFAEILVETSDIIKYIHEEHFGWDSVVWMEADEI